MGFPKHHLSKHIFLLFLIATSFVANGQNVGIGISLPTRPLSFPAVLGKKISLYPGALGDAGFGVYGNELRIHSDYLFADITFGYDDYVSGFTERMRIKGNGNVGIGTQAPLARLHVKDSSVLFSSAIFSVPLSAGLPPVEGQGRRMMWYPDKAAFRVGGVTNSVWDRDSIGNFSIALGVNPKAKGNNSMAFGTSVSANGLASMALGQSAVADGIQSTAMGIGVLASGNESMAFGTNTVASGSASMAFGTSTKALGGGTTAMGYNTKARGVYSTSMGYNTIAKGYCSTVVGMYNDSILLFDQSGLVGNSPLFIVGNGDFNSTRSNALVVMKSGDVGIGTSNPGFPLNFGNINGDKISFKGEQNEHYGIGLNVDLLQIHTDVATADIAFGSGSSLNFTETMRIKGTGNVGIGTPFPNAGALLHISTASLAKGLLVTGTHDNTFSTVPSLGAGARLMYYPGKGSFRAGVVTGNQWDQTYTGNISIAMGSNTIASGDYSTAMGRSTIADGFLTTAFGDNTHATGQWSMAMGENTIAKSGYETVLGRWNTDYTPLSSTGWNAADRLFTIGNGTGSGASSSNALTVLKNGNIGIGSSNPSAKLDINGALRFTNVDCINGTCPPGGAIRLTPNLHFNAQTYSAVIVNWDNGSGDDAPSFRVGNGEASDVFYVNYSGDAWLQGTLSGPSDMRLKKDIIPIENSLERITKLNGYNFYWKNEKLSPNLQTGVIAQELQTLFPDLVKEDMEGVLSVNYIGLIPVLIESIKDQQKQIDELKSLVAQLLKQ